MTARSPRSAPPRLLPQLLPLLLALLLPAAPVLAQDAPRPAAAKRSGGLGGSTPVTVNFEARQEAEGQALASFHLYATSIEALSRVETGDTHTGVLLASTALGAVETLPSEYGTEVRALACEALSRADAPGARAARARTAELDSLSARSDELEEQLCRPEVAVSMAVPHPQCRSTADQV